MNYAEIIKLVNIYSCKVNLLYGELAKRQGLSLYYMMVFDAVAQSQPCTQKQISEEWLLPKQTVNAVVKDMQFQGIVTISPGKNKKEKLVSFTDIGIHTYQKMMESTNQIEKRVVEQMGENECLAALHAIEKYAEFFEKELHNTRNNSTNMEV